MKLRLKPAVQERKPTANPIMVHGLTSIQALPTENTSRFDVQLETVQTSRDDVQVDVHVDGQGTADTSRNDVHAINIQQGELDQGIDVYKPPSSPMFMRQQPMSTCNNETMMPMKPPLFMKQQPMPPSKNETMMLMKESEIHKEENIQIPDVSENEILPMFQDTSDTATDSNWYTTTERRKSLESLHIPEVTLSHFSRCFGSVSDLGSSTPPQPTDIDLNSSCTTVLFTSKQSIPSRINSTHSTGIEAPPAATRRLDTPV